MDGGRRRRSFMLEKGEGFVPSTPPLLLMATLSDRVLPPSTKSSASSLESSRRCCCSPEFILDSIFDWIGFFNSISVLRIYFATPELDGGGGDCDVGVNGVDDNTVLPINNAVCRRQYSAGLDGTKSVCDSTHFVVLVKAVVAIASL